MAVSDAIGRTQRPFGSSVAMKKFKPFLIGAIAGSLLMFVSLQFHLIRSEDGFRLVPRTPQPSLGLFFVDLRNWTPEDYADRPELARALVAHGDTDLVASSVSDRLLDDVSENGSALEQLRGLMDEDGALGSLQIPEGISEGGNRAAADSLEEFPDLFRLPFDEAKNPAVKQVARVDSLKASADADRQQGFPSIDSIFGTDSSGMPSIQDRRVESRGVPGRQRDVPLDPFRESDSAPLSEPSAQAQPAFTASEESDLISDMLFGDDDDVPVSDTGSSNGWQDTVAKSRDRLTNGVRSEVASRAGEMATDLRGQFQRTQEQAFDQTLETLGDYSSRKIRESLPGPIGNLLKSDSSLTPLPSARPGQELGSSRVFDALPPELEALQNGFDPFLK